MLIAIFFLSVIFVLAYALQEPIYGSRDNIPISKPGLTNTLNRNFFLRRGILLLYSEWKTLDP